MRLALWQNSSSDFSCLWPKLFPSFQQVRELCPSCDGELFPTTDITFKEQTTLFMCQEKMKQKCTIYLLTPQRFSTPPYVFFFFVVVFLRHVQYVFRTYKYLSCFIYSIKDMPNIKQRNSSKVVKS